MELSVRKGKVATFLLNTFPISVFPNHNVYMNWSWNFLAPYNYFIFLNFHFKLIQTPLFLLKQNPVTEGSNITNFGGIIKT
jgi:hypothetical protein